MRAKDGGCLVVDRQEPLGLSRRFELAYDLLSFAGVPMRGFGRVVDPLMLAVLQAGGDLHLRAE